MTHTYSEGMREPRVPSLSVQKLLALPTPAYLIDEPLLIQNLEILRNLREETGCKVLLAQKAYSAYQTYPLIGTYLDGTTASGLYEAKLGAEEMQGKQVHVFSPAYREEEMDELLSIADHLVFNSWSQWLRFREQILNHPKRPSCGLRINPGYSEVETELYDPCASGSRLGMPLQTLAEGMRAGWFEGLEGLHFHCLCEQDADVLERVWKNLESQIQPLLHAKTLRWINCGGGHHITRPDYQMDCLHSVIRSIQSYGLEVYLEPGEAIALNAGFLISEVIDLVENGIDLALLDTSAACHMPDVLEMPYRPRLLPLYNPKASACLGLPHAEELDSDETKRLRERLYEPSSKPLMGYRAGDPQASLSDAIEGNPSSVQRKKAGPSSPLPWERTYRLGGPTCLAGDVIGDYVFPAPLLPGDRVLFADLAIYSFVKSNTFNGMPLPHLLLIRTDGHCETLVPSTYDQFKSRL